MQSINFTYSPVLRGLAFTTVLLVLWSASSIGQQGPADLVDLRTGQLDFKVPLDLPSGVGQIAPPGMAISYVGSGNGAIGYYWSISGVPTLERVGPGLPAPTYDDSVDEFVLSIPGASGRLVPTDDGYGHFTTEYEQFVRAVKTNDDTWVVTDKSGTRYEFRSGRLQGETVSPSNSTVARWLIHTIEDRFGNSVEYSWQFDSGSDDPAPPSTPLDVPIDYMPYLEEIRWDPWALTIDYEPRPDPTFDFAQGFKRVLRLRATEICVRSYAESPSGEGDLLNRWVLNYYNAKHRQQSILASVFSGVPDGGGAATSEITEVEFGYANLYSVDGTGHVASHPANTISAQPGWSSQVSFPIEESPLDTYAPTPYVYTTRRALLENPNNPLSTLIPNRFVMPFGSGSLFIDLDHDGLLDQIHSVGGEVDSETNEAQVEGWYWPGMKSHIRDNAMRTFGPQSSTVAAQNLRLGWRPVAALGPQSRDLPTVTQLVALHPRIRTDTGALDPAFTAQVPPYFGASNHPEFHIAWRVGRALFDVNGDGVLDVLGGDEEPYRPWGATLGTEVERIDTGLAWSLGTSVDSSYALDPVQSPANALHQYAFVWESSATPDQRYFRAYENGYRLVDVNGDGLVDLVRGFVDHTDPIADAATYRGDSFYVRLNTGTGFGPVETDSPYVPPVAFAEFIWDKYWFPPESPETHKNPPKPTQLYDEWVDERLTISTGAHFVDLNGDGMQDIAYAGRTPVGELGTARRGVFWNTGHGWSEFDETFEFPFDLCERLEWHVSSEPAYNMRGEQHGYLEWWELEPRGVQFADLNVDGLLDMLVLGGHPTDDGVYLNTGSGFAKIQSTDPSINPWAQLGTVFGQQVRVAAPADQNPDSRNFESAVKLLDIDGDGAVDVLGVYPHKGAQLSSPGQDEAWWRLNGLRGKPLLTRVTSRAAAPSVAPVVQSRVDFGWTNAALITFGVPEGHVLDEGVATPADLAENPDYLKIGIEFGPESRRPVNNPVVASIQRQGDAPTFFKYKDPRQEYRSESQRPRHLGFTEAVVYAPGGRVTEQRFQTDPSEAGTLGAVVKSTTRYLDEWTIEPSLSDGVPCEPRIAGRVSFVYGSPINFDVEDPLSMVVDDAVPFFNRPLFLRSEIFKRAGALDAEIGTAFEYDAFGNTVAEHLLGAGFGPDFLDSDPSDNRVTRAEYGPLLPPTPDGDQLLDRPRVTGKQTLLDEHGAEFVARATYLTYDALPEGETYGEPPNQPSPGVRPPGVPTRIRVLGSAPQTLQYDLHGNVTSVSLRDPNTDAVRYSTLLSYEADSSSPSDNIEVVVSNPTSMPSGWRPTRVETPEGIVQVIGYDSIGRAKRSLSSRGEAAETDYGPSCEFAVLTQYEGQSVITNGVVTSVDWRARQAFETSVDAVGRTHRNRAWLDAGAFVDQLFDYDSFGRQVSTRTIGSTGLQGPCSAIGYDELGRVDWIAPHLSSVPSGEPGDSSKHQYAWDPVRGDEIAKTYMNVGGPLGPHPASKQDGLSVLFEDPNGRRYRIRYGAFGQRDSVVTLVETTNSFVETPSTPPGEYVTTLEYNSLGDLTSVLDAVGNATTDSYVRARHTTTHRFEGPGYRLIETTHPDRGPTTLTYNPDGTVKERLTEGLVSYTYDLLGRVTAIVEEDGTRTDFYFGEIAPGYGDPWGRGPSDPEHVYDEGRPTQKRRQFPTGEVLDTFHAYDQLGRVVAELVRWTVGPCTAGECAAEVGYEYFPDGRISALVYYDGSGQRIEADRIEITPDALGRPTNFAIDSSTAGMMLGWNTANGKLSELTFTASGSALYRQDFSFLSGTALLSRHKVTRVAPPGLVYFDENVIRNMSGDVTEIRNIDGVFFDYDLHLLYDDLHRLTKATYDIPGTIQDEMVAFDYDPIGNKVWQRGGGRSRPRLTGDFNDDGYVNLADYGDLATFYGAGDWRVDLDQNGLINVGDISVFTAFQSRYLYNSQGDCDPSDPNAECYEDSEERSYEYSPLRPHAVQDDGLIDAPASYPQVRYGRAGGKARDANHYFLRSAEGPVKQAFVGEQEVEVFLRDESGVPIRWRFKEEWSGNEHTVDFLHPLLWLSSKHGKIKRIDMGRALLEVRDNVEGVTGGTGGARYYIRDYRGDTRFVLDEAGGIVERTDYYPFGETRSQDGDAGVLTPRFQGAYRSPLMGNYVMGPRLYDPGLGRFLSPDSVDREWTSSDAGDVYAYAANSPYVYRDPTGWTATGTSSGTISFSAAGSNAAWVSTGPSGGASGPSGTGMRESYGMDPGTYQLHFTYFEPDRTSAVGRAHINFDPHAGIRDVDDPLSPREGLAAAIEDWLNREVKPWLEDEVGPAIHRFIFGGDVNPQKYQMVGTSTGLSGGISHHIPELTFVNGGQFIDYQPSNPYYEGAKAVGWIAMSIAPGPGEMLDFYDLTRPDALWWERGIAGVSLAANTLVPILPNASGIVRAIRAGPEVVDAARGAPRAYSTAFETRIAASSYPGVSRARHFQEANEQLLRTMEASPEFAAQLRGLGVNLERTATGLVPRTPPAGWTWHHEVEAGVMRLVPRAQHTPGSSFWDVLHPGGRGGYSIWGK